MKKLITVVLLGLILSACSDDSPMSRLKKSHYNSDGSILHPMCSEEDKNYWSAEEDKNSEAWKNAVAYCSTQNGKNELCDQFILATVEAKEDAEVAKLGMQKAMDDIAKRAELFRKENGG